MVLNDVWRRIAEEVGFYYRGNFEEVPANPGVYAWFYPLRVLSRSPQALSEIVTEVHSVLNYDAAGRGSPSRDADVGFTWWSLRLRAEREMREFQLTPYLGKAWETISADDRLFVDFQESLLKASIFMPPLYVGKADDLRIRCSQHLYGAEGENNFHHRFQDYASTKKLRLRLVSDLIFACVRTAQDEDGAATEAHLLIEAMMKSICAPSYGAR